MIRLVEPAFKDPLTDLIMELDYRRIGTPGGSMTPALFLQLVEIFRMLEALGSARLAGNSTTVADLVEAKPENPDRDDQLQAIRNVEAALAFIEEAWSRDPVNFRIDHGLVRELHRLTTTGLSADDEGGAAPGFYRTPRLPPDPADIHSLMDELFVFINKPDPPKYDLLKIALAHHGFTRIHPFTNGNGRTARLFTYALLLKTGLPKGGSLAASRLLNPTAAFCRDRDEYRRMLSRADAGGDEGLLDWCSYVLSGLKTELDKAARLLDYEWLKKSILAPAIQELHQKNGISNHEKAVLLLVLERGVVRNQDVRPTLKKMSIVQTSRILADLRRRQLLVPTQGAERSYELGISHSPLLRMVLRQLDRHGFLPLKGEI